MISGSSTIYLNDVALVGSEVKHWSAGSSSNLFEAGTFISVGTSTVAPGSSIPFFLQHSVTISGINFIYPYEITKGTIPPPYTGPLFSDDGVNGPGDILFENVTAIAPYVFWRQQGGNPSPTYGDIRFSNVDIYGILQVFDWSNVQDTVAFDNFQRNPSLCSGGFTQCSAALEAWTENNGTWLHVGGSGSSSTYQSAVGGLQASNLTVSAYRNGVVVDSNGHLDESLFGSTTVFDGVPTVLYVNSNGSITHTTFSGKVEYGGTGLCHRRYFS